MKMMEQLVLDYPVHRDVILAKNEIIKKLVLGIPDICQFWYATAQFRPLKKYAKKSVNSQQNSPYWPK